MFVFVENVRLTGGKERVLDSGPNFKADLDLYSRKIPERVLIAFTNIRTSEGHHPNERYVTR